MARLARAEVFSPDEVAIVQVINRTVRRCYLLGNDPLTGKNYDHRKTWMEDELQHLAAHFGIDLLCYAILSNHFHLVLRSRPDIVKLWMGNLVRWEICCHPRMALSNKSKGSATVLNLVNRVFQNILKLLSVLFRDVGFFEAWLWCSMDV